MANKLYVMANEARSGKSVISLGVMEMLRRHGRRAGFFRPIVRVDPAEGVDADLRLIKSRFGLSEDDRELYGCCLGEARAMVSKGRYDEMLEAILSRYRALEDRYDFVVCEGSDFEDIDAVFEFDINVEVANHLACPVLNVVNGAGRTLDEIASAAQLTDEALEEKRCTILCTVVNRVTEERIDSVVSGVRERMRDEGALVYALPEEPMLGYPTIGDLAQQLGAEVLYGAAALGALARGVTVAAMQLGNFLAACKDGAVVVTPGDREDIIAGTLASLRAPELPHISGLILTGGLRPQESICRLIEAFGDKTPLLSVGLNTSETLRRLEALHISLRPEDELKVSRALELFEERVDTDQLCERIELARSSVVTPMMFEHGLVSRASAEQRTIVLPEGIEPRILRAAEILRRRGVCQLVLLGEQARVRERASALGISLEGLEVIDPVRSADFEDYVETYAALRAHKGVTLDMARDQMSDVSYFGTMMVYKGAADGMVSGSINTTAHTIRPSFEFVKTKPGIKTVSSVFFMCLPDRVLVYGDCAIVPRPSSEQLAEIAVSSAATARLFGVEPRVALLSYSTGSSGRGEEVEKVRAATALARASAPSLLIEGPIQYDAAVDPGVARTKMPDSEVAGRATVFVFPDLNTGNNTYKAVQRSAGAVAVGPVLQGLRKPVNDLSRGCTVADIVNTVAITAIQAQEAEGS
jgi:phosphate acetyltransferase